MSWAYRCRPYRFKSNTLRLQRMGFNPLSSAQLDNRDHDRPCILPTFRDDYKCLNIYLLLYRVYLECLPVQVRYGEIW